jgi:hypothetical protein
MMNDLDTPDIVAQRKAIRACLLSGEGYEDLVDILANEDSRLEAEQRAAGVPPPPRFAEQYKAYVSLQVRSEGLFYVWARISPMQLG